MAEEGLKIKLGADDAELQQGLQRAGASIENFSHHVSASTFLARNAVLDFGHTLRDLPYAISNPALLTGPIDRTVQLFTQLQQQGGGVKGALASIGSILSGSGGILIGFELLTTAATFFFKGMISGSEQAKAKLDDFNKILNTAASEASKQAASVTSLVDALQSGTLNPDQRKKALEQLKEQNAQYFGQLKEENGIVVGLSAAYQAYIDQLNKVGIAKAVEAEISKLFDKKLQLQLSIDPKFVAATDQNTQEFIGKLQKQLESLGGAVDVSKLGNTNIFSDENAILRKRIDIQGQIAKAEEGNKFFQDKAYNDTVKQIQDIDLRIKGLADFQKNNGIFDIKAPPKNEDALKQQIEALTKLQQDFQKVGIDASDVIVQLGKLKEQLAIRDAVKLGVSPEQLTAQIIAIKDEVQKQLNAQADKIDIPLKPSIDIKPADLSKLAAESDKVVNPFSKAVEKLFKEQNPTKLFSQKVLDAQEQAATNLKHMTENAKNLGEVLQKDVAPAFDNFFNDILSGKGLKAFEAFGQAILDIIKKLAEAAIEALIFNAIIGAVTGGTSATGAGFGGMSGFKNIFGQLSGIHLNSVNSGGITGAHINSANYQLVGTLHGQDIRIALNRVDKTNNRIH